jgi:hypothetical protein
VNVLMPAPLGFAVTFRTKPHENNLANLGGHYFGLAQDHQRRYVRLISVWLPPQIPVGMQLTHSLLSWPWQSDVTHSLS